MTVIEVRPCKRFNGAWIAFEARGVEPAVLGPNGKQDAIDYARDRFGGTRGEIHVYDNAGETIIERIAVDGGSGYGQQVSSI